MTKAAVRDCSQTVLSADSKLIDFIGLCELQDARARYHAQECLQEDEIMKTRVSDKYGDHVHLTICVKTGTQPGRQEYSLADSIAQTEFRKAINPAEYMKTSKGKAVNLGVDTLRDLKSSSVQQSPVISRLRDVMLPNYSGDLDDLVDSTHTQTSSEREATERTSHGPGSVMGDGPEEKSYEPKRQNNKGNAIAGSDLARRTEQEWDYMNSREERHVMLVPLLDSCKACKKEKGRERGGKRKRRNDTSLPVTEATNDPDSDGGAHEFTGETSEDAPGVEATAASTAPEPNDVIFEEFTEQTLEETLCMPITEVSYAPELDRPSFDEMSEESPHAPDTRDEQTFQHDGAVFEQTSGENLGALITKASQSPSHHEVSSVQMEKKTGGGQRERSDVPDPDMQVFDQTREDILPELETRETHTLQYDGASSERMGEKTHDMQSKEGSDAPGPANKSVDEAVEDILGEPEKTDRPDLQHDGAFSEQVGEKTVDVQAVEGSDDLEFEKRLLDQLSEYIKGNPETNNTPYFQEDGTEGANAMEPRIHVREHSIENARFKQATQRTIDTQQYWDFLDQISETPLRIQVPDETSALEPYVDILRRCPFSAKIELTTMNGIFAAPEPMAQTNRQAKQSLPTLQSRHGTNAIQHNRKWPEQAVPRIQVPKGTDAPEPYVDILRRCPFSEKIELRPMDEIYATREPMAKAIRQASFVDRIDLLKLPEGIYPRKPSTETKVARQTPLPLPGYADQVDGLQIPYGDYLQNYPTEVPQPAQVPIGYPFVPTITPPYPTGTDQQQPALVTAGQKRAQSQELPSQEFISWGSAEARRVMIPLEIESEGESRLEHSPTHDFMPSNPTANGEQQNSQEVHGEGGPQYIEPPTQDFWPSNLTANGQQQNSQKIHGEDGPQLIEPPTQDFWPSISTGVSQQLWSSKIRRERESVLAVPPPQDFGHLKFTGIHQQQFPAELRIEDDVELERPPTQDFQPLNLTGDHRQQRSRELGIEDDFALEAPPILDFRPLTLAGAQQQQRSAGLGIEGNSALEGPPTQDIGLPDFEAPLPYRRPSELETEGKLALENLLTKDFRSWNLTGAHQQERPLELGMESNFALEGIALEKPPRQAFMPSDFASARQYQHSSDRAMQGDKRLNWSWSNHLGPEGLTGARQPQHRARQKQAEKVIYNRSIRPQKNSDQYILPGSVNSNLG
ncbi:MAG: hypothetical protein OHK93_005062 [Ramalina farinacea]|uniref:Uncharacterized protein n=1 Tax=Ramalina farinacea TaxID=258253 RepID=A0AA43TZA9_9LECA|nr:hypothetical protein [Ramalina farinacea]